MTINRLKIFLIIILLIFAVSAVHADESRWDISLAFIGPADPIYSWWGHVAIIVEDQNSGSARYYDYGNFSFSEDSFINNFIMGRLFFLKQASNPGPQLRYSAFLNRDVTLYKLNISEKRKREIIRFLENDVKPENQIYLYDHFYDNCSTRIRDIIDTASNGALSETGKEPSGTTLRQQLRRFTYSRPLMDWLLNFAMKGRVDLPANKWETMFLPSELEKYVSSLMIEADDGTYRPLVTEKTIYNRSEGRADIPQTPPPSWLFGLITGIIIATAAFFLQKSSYKIPAARRGLGVLSMLISLIFGIAGSLLFFMAVFTDHAFTYWNMNLLFINPFLLVIFIISIGVLSGKERKLRLLNRCWTIVSIGAVLSILLKIIPVCRQDNWSCIFLILLPAMVFSGILQKIHGLKTPST